MIKPVYFGKEDEVLLGYVNELKDFNFSNWVKKKIKEKMGINETEIEDSNKTDIEILIRRIIKEEVINNGSNEKVTGEDKVEIEVEVVKHKEPDIDKIEIGGWTL